MCECRVSKKILSSLFLGWIFTLQLLADLSSQMDLYAIAVTEFTITLSANTTTHFFTGQEITNNASARVTMGTFTLSIEDIDKPTNGHNVYLYSFFKKSDNVMQLSDRGGLLSETIDLYVYSDKASDGTTSDTELQNGSLVRTRAASSSPALDEDQLITVQVEIGGLTGKSNGDFENYLYFVVETI